MMANKCLFIGGHMDGRLEVVPDSLNIQERVVPKQNLPGSELGATRNFPTMATERYYRYFFPGGKAMHQMMVLTSITQDKVLELLLAAYHNYKKLLNENNS